MHPVRPAPSDVPLAVGVKSGTGIAPVQGLWALPAEDCDALTAEFEIEPSAPGRSPPDVRLIPTPPASALLRDLLSEVTADNWRLPARSACVKAFAQWILAAAGSLTELKLGSCCSVRVRSDSAVVGQLRA